MGGHSFTAGGLVKGVTAYLDATGASAVQVYVSNPRGWARPDGSPERDEAFRALCAERNVVAWVHACLLVNLGSPTPATVAQSVEALRHAVRRAGEIGARGVVFHAGSAVDRTREAALRQAGEALLPVLDGLDPDGPRLLVEPSAGGGRSLAKRVEDLGPYLDAVGRHPMLGVCFDTCHAWAAGHDLAAPGGATATMDALVDAVGPDRLWLLHANDSRDACGSTRDRHENVGAGTIGLDPFAAILSHPATRNVPVIVETPGLSNNEGHARDIAALRAALTPPAR